MAPVTFNDLDALFKRRYTEKKVYDMTLRDHPALAYIPKATQFGGKSWTVPMIAGNPTGIGSKFAAAQANKGTPGDQLAMEIRRARQYGIYSIDGETLAASESDADAFMRGQALLSDRVMAGVMDETAIKLFRDGTGVKATFKSTVNVATATAALTNPGDVRLFSVGEVVSLVDPVNKVYRNPGGNGGATMQVLSIDEDNGTLTFTSVGGTAAVAISTSIAAAAASDLLVRDGDYQATPQATSGTILNLSGFAAWIPGTAPTSGDSFWGQDRSRYAARYAGVRLTAPSGQLYKKTLTKLASKIADAGGKPELAIVDFSNFELIETELDAKRVYEDSPTAGIGFETIKINGPKGPITILADNRCQPDRVYMLQRDTWELRSAGAFPRLIDDDGRGSMREVSADGVEWRLGGYPQLICHAPGYNGVAFF